MRPLEIALCVASLPLLTWCLFGRVRSDWARVLPAVALMLLVAQVVVEGARWHLGPAYLLTLYLFLVCAWPGVPALAPGRWTAVGGILALGAAAALSTVLPVFRLPAPTGPYPIGTVTLHLIDSAREETLGDRPGGPRELMVQIWYPAGHAGPGEPYRPFAESSLVKYHLALVRTHAARGVPVAGARPRYPVLLFSPGWVGRRNQNTVQAEELASHGFVVVGIDHPYGTELTRFPDGRTARTVLGEFLDCSTDETVRASVRVVEEQLRVRVADVRFVLDELERLNRADPDGLLTGRLDTSQVGVFGHSFGGAVAAEVCRTDPRVRAGVDLDGLLFGEAMTKGIGKPFLCLVDDTPIPTAAILEKVKGADRRWLTFVAENAKCIRHRLSETDGYWVKVRGTSHMNYCDSPLYCPLKAVTHAGPIRHERATEVIDAYLLSFFQARLKGDDDHLLDAPSPRYPEVEIERLAQDEN
jgi:dienelactone hydrolase